MTEIQNMLNLIKENDKPLIFYDDTLPYENTISGSKVTDSLMTPRKKSKNKITMLGFTPTSIAETALVPYIPKHVPVINTSNTKNVVVTPQTQPSNFNTNSNTSISAPKTKQKRANIKMVTLRNSKKTSHVKGSKIHTVTKPKRKPVTTKAKKAALRKDIQKERMYRGNLTNKDKICLTIGQLLQKLNKFKLK